MIDFVKKFKSVTHLMALGAVFIVWAAHNTMVGQDITNQFPIASQVVEGAGILLTLYHIPIKNPFAKTAPSGNVPITK